MHCRCADASCLDRGVACGECDEDGYATSARRRLKRRADGTVQDIDDQQVFKVKKTKTGVRLVPIFHGRIDWKGAQGFAAMRLLLSCLGADGEYVLWDSEKNEEMDVAGWHKRKYGCGSIASIWHRRCGEINMSTHNSSLAQGIAIGCRCNSTNANSWRLRRAEVVQWGKARGFEVLTTAEQWLEQCTSAFWCPTMRCVKCKKVVERTLINNLQQGHNIGCGCNSAKENRWNTRLAEVVEWGETRGFEVLTTVEEWLEQCTSAFWCPTVRCVKCMEIVTSTCLAQLQQGGNIGCRCHSNHANNWRNRRAEVVQWGEERGFKVLTSEEEWQQRCRNCRWCPTLYCIKCQTTVQTTQINYIQQNGGIGCVCRNKTEKKLNDWLNKHFPPESGVIVSPQYRGPKTKCNGQTNFDVNLTFPDGFEVFVELDGPQHFWTHEKWHTDDGCERDLLKEEWAAQRGLCVIRVLQEDVWDDRLDWQGWLVRSIAAARSGEPRPITPDAPEYRSHESAYVRLRDHSCNGL